MGRTGTAALRLQVLLWVGVVAVSLSLLAMHQLSLNHTAASPLPAVESVGVVEGSGSSRSIVDDRHGHAGQHGHVGQHLLSGADHPAEAAGVGTGSHDACPGCAQHHVMVLTCLVALVLLATGWLLRGPPVGRTIGVAQLLHRLHVAVPRWRPPPLTWIELSVSRT